MIAYTVEGRLAKAIAVAAIFDKPGGLRLRRARLPGPRRAAGADRRTWSRMRGPHDEAEAAQHDEQIERAPTDLMLGGKLVWRAGAPPCGCCKDIDEHLASIRSRSCAPGLTAPWRPS